MLPDQRKIDHNTREIRRMKVNIELYDKEFPLLEEVGLYAKQTTGDGDCLFHALSDQVGYP
jgi:hypothetical protein